MTLLELLHKVQMHYENHFCSKMYKFSINNGLKDLHDCILFSLKADKGWLATISFPFMKLIF